MKILKVTEFTYCNPDSDGDVRLDGKAVIENKGEFDVELVKVSCTVLNNSGVTVGGSTNDDDDVFINPKSSEEININSGEDGLICIPVMKLNEILSALPDCELNFSVSSDGKITINNNLGNYTVMAHNPEEFPSEPILDSVNNITFNSTKLKHIINSTIYAVSKDDLKPVLQGVLFNIQDKNLTAVSTDGHRLVKISTGISTDLNQRVIVPNKFLSALIDNMNNDENIELQLSENHIMVQLLNINIISRIIKEPYPDFEAVIPYENNKKVNIDKDDLINAVKRVSIFSNKTTKQITLSFTEGETIISTEDPDNVTSAKESIQCDYKDEDIIMGYNAQFLLDVLKNQTSTNITIKLENSLTAGIFVSDPIADEDKITLLMPIRLNN